MFETALTGSGDQFFILHLLATYAIVGVVVALGSMGLVNTPDEEEPITVRQAITIAALWPKVVWDVIVEYNRDDD